MREGEHEHTCEFYSYNQMRNIKHRWYHRNGECVNIKFRNCGHAKVASQSERIAKRMIERNLEFG